MPAGNPIQGIGKATGDKRSANFDLFTPVPPIGRPGIKDILRRRFGCGLLTFVRVLDLYLAVQAFFFSSEGCWTGWVSVSWE